MNVKAFTIVKTCFLALSILLWTFISYCYLRRPDECAAITLWPAWIWILPGALLTALGYSTNKRLGLALLLTWLLTMGTFSEEPKSLLRSIQRLDPQFQTARREGNGLRVITLNCAGGSLQAAFEVSAHNPDVVLLQESPVKKKDVEALGRRLFGNNAGVLCGLDTSVLANGKITQLQLDHKQSSFFTAARVHLTTGAEIYVISARLMPPVARFDLWSPECWKGQKENRLFHKEQIRLIAAQIRQIPGDAPILLGGDMNAPAGDGALSLLHPRMHDTFREGGRGWGNTVLNDIPISRIDQIWASRHFNAVSVIARKPQTRITEC